MHTVAIVGSREFKDYELMVQCMEDILGECGVRWGLDWDKSGSEKCVLIVSGGARGADILAERYAKECGFYFTAIPANWDLYGKRAGMMRNAELVASADLVVAFWDGRSKGTADTIERTQLMDKELRVIFYEEEGHNEAS